MLYSAIPSGARSGQFLEIFGPQIVFPAGEFIKIAPGVEASVVTVAEHKANRIISDRFNRPDRHVPFAGHEFAFRG